MIESFDISELPERITQYRNQVLSEALTKNAPYLRQMTDERSQGEAAAMWQSVAQYAVNALSNYMAPRVDSLTDRDDPRLVFYENDESEPVRSFVNAWIEGYATRALGGRCSESDVRPAVEQAGIALYPIDNRIAYAETILPQRGYSRECVSVAIGHAILSYAITLSDEMDAEERVRFNWMGDIDGFANGWRYAQRHGLGIDGDYVPYSDEDQIDSFMRSLTDSPSDDGAKSVQAKQEHVDYDEFEDVSEDEVHNDMTLRSRHHDASATSVSLPSRYASVFEHTGDLSQEAAGTTGIYIEVDEGTDDQEQDSGSSGIVMTSEPEIFTSDEITDETGDDLLHIRTTVDDSPNSITGSLVAVVPQSAESTDDEQVTERSVKRLPPIFEKYLLLSVSSAFRGNANRLAELTEAGMTFEQSDRLKRKVMAATAKYGLRELSIMRQDDGVPADLDGTEPVRTYANSWLQGYISVITDGEYSQDAIIKSALMSVVTAEDIVGDIRHVVERQEWEGYDDECSMVTVAHLKVSLSMHNEGHPMAHAMEGTGRFSRRGATDGFSDGWWKAMGILRKVSENPEANMVGMQLREDDADPNSSENILKAKEEAKMLLAGLFNEDDILPEESVNELIGPPMPIPSPTRQANTADQGTGEIASGTPEEQGVPKATQGGSTQQRENDRMVPDGNGRHMRQEQPSPLQSQNQSQHPARKVARKKQSTQDRIRSHADACAVQSIKQHTENVKEMWRRTNTNKERARAWTNAVMQATASYGWHIVNDLKANPAKSKDGTRPMLTYASGWVTGYIAGFGIEEPTDRELQEMSQRMGISFGEIGERIVYARELCSAKGYGPDCKASLMRHMKHMFVMHDPRNPEASGASDAHSYNWIADIDGYADGWFIAQRVRIQQERQ